ncbi:MAG TPA: helix-turn-helix domain-containing protein [Pyrinomonadaceae bacterium]|nr:helix-turn-helix domain-containing protein [Pyrinomonadaceae bacterium]
MIHKLHFPQSPLSQFVENIWLVQGFASGYTREKILPDGAIELIIDLDTTPKTIFDDEASQRFRTVSKGWISGERTRYIVIGAMANQSMVGIRFRPGRAYPFFSFPISELSETVTELDLIWGGLVDEVRDQLIGIESPDERLLHLESFLLGQARRSLESNRLISYAVNQLQHSPQFLAIRDLANTIGITQKHLISQFEKVVGLRPKSFARVCKFQKVVNLIEQQKDIEWAAIAADCGYYDQAHFIHEFQTFSGLNPSAYLKQRGDYVNYIPIN